MPHDATWVRASLVQTIEIRAMALIVPPSSSVQNRTICSKIHIIVFILRCKHHVSKETKIMGERQFSLQQKLLNSDIKVTRPSIFVGTRTFHLLELIFIVTIIYCG